MALEWSIGLRWCPYHVLFGRYHPKYPFHVSLGLRLRRIGIKTWQKHQWL